jgi:DNA-binding beta-propeller fold protein YncE
MKRLLLTAIAGLLMLPASASAARQAWVSSNHIQVVDLDAGKVVGRIDLKEFIHDIEFSPDGNTAYVASSKGLRVADANAIRLDQHVDTNATRGISVSADGNRIIAIHRAPKEDALAARKAGLPLPPSTLTVYSAKGMTKEASFPVSGDAFDSALSADGTRIWILVPQTGKVLEYAEDGSVTATIQVVDQGAAGPGAAMLSELALSPDGSKLVVPVTNAENSWLAEINVAGKTPSAVVDQGLGHARRIQGVRWDEDGSGVYVTAINSMVKFDGRGLPVAWKSFSANYVDVQGLPGSDQVVVVTPTLSKSEGTGGVGVLDASGEVLRTVALPDMSPFVVAVRP